MNLIFLGNKSLIGEWLAVCTDHRCIVFKANATMTLPDHARLVTSADEIDEADLVVDLHQKTSGKRRRLLKALESRIGTHVPVLVNTTTSNLSVLQSWFRIPERVYGIAALPTLIIHPLVEIAVSGSHRAADPGRNRSGVESVEAAIPDVVRSFFGGLGKRIEVTGEGVGQVFPRVLCMIVNEAAYALQQQIATEEDIDTAMKLGVNYPFGPLEWGRRIGWKHVLRVLEAMHREFGDDRYRPSPLLRSLAAR